MHKLLNVFTLIAALTLISSVFAAKYPEENGVLILGDSNLDAAIKEFENLLVMFYSPWNDQYNEMAPEYEQAAATLKLQKVDAKLAKVDATKEIQSDRKYQVKSYPTLKFFKDGEAYNYTGGNDAYNIATWTEMKSGWSYMEIGHPKQFDTLMMANRKILVFIGKRKDEGFKAFERASRIFEEIIFLFASSTTMKEKLDVSENTKVILLTKTEDGRHELKGSFDEERLFNFIREATTPIFIPFNSLETAKQIFGGTDPYMFLLTIPTPEMEKVEDIFNSAAKKLDGKIKFTRARIDDGDFGFKAAAYTAVDEHNIPAVIHQSGPSNRLH